MANYQEISFPEGWFNTYPQTPPNKTQHVPKKSQTTNRPDKQPDILQPVYKLIQPVCNLLLQAWLGLLSLTISMSRDENDKNPKVGEQKQTEQTNKQANTDGSSTGINPKHKCTICLGPHSNLMFCTRLKQYLPFGGQQPTPVWLCTQCLSTKHWNAKYCNHMNNKHLRRSLCPISNKHYLLCNICEHHLPGIGYMNYHHEPSLGYSNFSVMRQCFGKGLFRSLISNNTSASSINNACKVH